MRDNLRLLVSDKLIRLLLFSSVALIFLQISIIFIFFSRLPPLIPLLNSQPWGIERLSPSSSIFILPVLLIGMFLLNSILAAAFYRRNTLISRILSFNSTLFITLSLLAFFQIILLVF